MIVNTVEGENVYVNEQQITCVRRDDKHKSLTLLTLACGTTLRTNDEFYALNGDSDVASIYE